MTIFFVICGAVLAGCLVGLLVGIYDNFDGSLALLAGTLSGCLCLLAALLIMLAQQDKRIDELKNKAEKQCNPYQARIFEDPEKQVVIFSCANDGKLNTLSYK